MDFDLLEFQKTIISQGRDLLIPETHDLTDMKLQAERIKQMYQNARKDRKLRKNVYDNLFGNDDVLKLAAIDLISRFPNEHAVDILFKALEDEGSVHIRQNIVKALDSLEAKNSDYIHQHDISVVHALNCVKLS